MAILPYYNGKFLHILSFVPYNLIKAYSSFERGDFLKTFFQLSRLIS
jgi:hypothetical protein